MKDAILRASTMAHVQDLAFLTQAGQSIQFSLPKRLLRWTFQKVDQWNLLDISQTMFHVNEVIA